MLWAFPSLRTACATLLLCQASSISLSPSPLARAVPSPVVGLLLPVLVHVSLWTLALDTIPSPASGAMPCSLSPTLWLPCDGKPGCGLGGWMLLRYEHSMGPSLANWVAGGKARCLFSLHECLEPWNGLAWIPPVISSPPRYLGSPLSFHHLKPTQN